MKQKNFRRFLSVALALTMLLSAVPVMTLALTMGTKPADGTTTGNPFTQGTGGSNSFRIPAMVTLNDGTIVAAADARWNTTYDGGGLDTIVSYSTDNGANWNYTFANYLGDNGNEYNGSGSTAFIDPALATDGSTVYMLCDLYPYGVALNGSGNTAPSTAVGFNDDGTLKLAASGSSTYNYYLKDGQIYDSSNNAVSGYTVDAYFNITGNGYDTNLFFSDSPYQVVRTGYLYLTKSTDGGKTWSAPTLIPNVKTSSEQVCLVGPGRGLVTGGKIIFPVYSYNGSSSSQQMGFIYSTDNGATWTRSANFTGDTWSSESAVVALSDGTLRFFYRNGNSKLYYVDYNVSSNTWGSAVNTGIATNSNTQISAIALSNTVDGKQVILVSCPTGSNNAGSADSSASARLNGRIQIGLVDSTDNSMTWKTPIDVTTNNSQFMYSCLTALTDSEGNQTGEVAILYENQESAWGTGDNCYYTMAFATYDLNDYVTFDGSSGNDTGSGDTNNGADGVPVTLTVGESTTVTDDTGNYSGSYTGAGLDTTKATVTVSGTDTSTDGSYAKATSITSGKQYLITIDGNHVVTNTVSTNGRSDYGYWSGASGLYIESVSGFAYGNNLEQYLWTITESDSGYTVQNANGKYLTIGSGNNNVTLSDTAQVLTVTDNGDTFDFSSGDYYLNNFGGTDYDLFASSWQKGNSGWTLYEYTPGTTAGTTTITFTGVSAGTTSVVVGGTLYNITVNRKTQDVSVRVGGSETYTDASTSTPVVADSSVATATLSGGTLTINGVAEGTTTITTDTTVYTVTVSDGTELEIKENETTTISVTLEDGQTVEWSSADSSYVGVAGKYDTTIGAYTNEAILAGQNVTSSPVVVTATIKDADGNVVGTQKWLVTVTEADADTNTSSRHIYVNVTEILNCTVYYSINGGELIGVNGTGIVIDEDTSGHFNIMFFAAPKKGYALTYMCVTGSGKQYYDLADGNPDGTGSDAWPFTDAAQSTIPSDSSDSAWVSGHGFRWALLEGNMTIDQMKVLFSNALALGCTGATNFTKNASDSFYTEIQCVAQPLPTIVKEITSINGIDYTEGTKVKIGDTINYTITITKPAELTGDVWDGVAYTTTSPITDTNKPNYSENSSYGTITYSNESLTDELTNNDGISDFALGTSSDSDVTYPYTTSLTLTKENFGTVVTGSTITNTADLSFHYETPCGKGDYSTSAEAVVDVTVDIPVYMVDFGLPVEIDLSYGTSTGKITGGTATYGTVVPNETGTGFIYTPTQVLRETDRVTFTYTQSGEDYEYQVDIVPASNVLYEDNFLTENGTIGTSYRAWTKTEATSSAKQAAVQTALYGYDDAYKSDTGNSLGSCWSINSLTSGNGSKYLTTTFYGTGFDLIGTAGLNTGYVYVLLTGPQNKLIIIDTSYVDGEGTTLYQVPLAHEESLTEGTYTVNIRAAYRAATGSSSSSGSSSAAAYSLYGQSSAVDDIYAVVDELLMDGLDFDDYEFIYADPGSPLAELDNATYAMTYTTDDSGDTSAETTVSRPEGTTVTIDGFRAYGDSYNDAYLEDEQGVTYVNVLDAVNGEKIIAYIEPSDSTSDAGYSVAEYESLGGPQNEIYLAKNQSVAFAVNPGSIVQVSARAVGSSPAVMSDSSGTTTTIASNTEMYYPVTVNDSGIVTITNTGEGMLALGNLKIKPAAQATALVMALSEDEYPVVFSMLRMAAAPVEPEEPEVSAFTPETLEYQVRSVDTFRGQQVTVTITTSTDVAKLTVNGQELKPINSWMVKLGWSNTYTYVLTETVGKGESISYEIVAYNADDLASTVYSAEPEAFTPEQLDIEARSANTYRGRQVTLTITASTDVAKLTVNGMTLRPTNSQQVKWGQSATYTYVFAETVRNGVSKSYEVIAYDAYGVASEVRTVEPAEPEAFTPEQLDIEARSANTYRGRQVTLTITTSTDVAKLTVNGMTLRPTNSQQVKWGQSATYTYVFAETVRNGVSKSYEVIAYDAYGVASEVRTVEPTEPEAFTPGQLDIQARSANTYRGRQVTLTITTSTDVAKLTVNGMTLRPTNSQQVKWGMSDTYTYVFAETVRNGVSKSYEVIAYDAYGVASEVRTVEPAEPEAFTPGQLDIEARSANTFRGREVTLTITASTDVAKLTVNGMTLRPTNSQQVKWGMSDTYTYVFAETVRNGVSKSYEVIAYDAYGVASEPTTATG